MVAQVRPSTGTSASAAVPGSTSGTNRAAAGSGGVCPPMWNQDSAKVAVRPDATMLIAMPDTTWLPPSVTLA